MKYEFMPYDFFCIFLYIIGWDVCEVVHCVSLRLYFVCVYTLIQLSGKICNLFGILDVV